MNKLINVHIFKYQIAPLTKKKKLPQLGDSNYSHRR